MTTFYGADDITAAATPEVALAAARQGLLAEAQDVAVLPPRIDVSTSAGFIRCMPAVLGDVMGLKVMTLVRGHGTRYLVLLYDTGTGELEAILDAEHVTALRTAAVTAVAGDLLVDAPPTRVGVIGSGFEARNHVRTLAHHWPLESAVAWSRVERNREEFAEAMTASLGIEVTAAAASEEATKAGVVVVLATKSAEPVVDGSQFLPDAVVLSIGSTRPDLRELDTETMARAGTLLVDSVEQVLAESGDIIEGLRTGALDRDRVVSVAEALADPTLVRRDAVRDLLVFKSVGTALQDLALARAVHRAPEVPGRDLGTLSSFKPFVGTGAPT